MDKLAHIYLYDIIVISRRCVYIYDIITRVTMQEIAGDITLHTHAICFYALKPSILYLLSATAF